MTSPKRLAAAVLAALLLAEPASATTVLAVPVEEMAKGSPVVVRATVESQETGWDRDRLNIETRTTLVVTQRLKGDTASRIVVTQVGGIVGEKGQYVPGDAKFKVGEDVVVFLEPRPGGEFVLTGMALAKFRVVKQDGRERLTRDLSGLSFAARDAQGLIRATEQVPASDLDYATLARLFDVTPAPVPTPKLRAK